MTSFVGLAGSSSVAKHGNIQHTRDLHVCPEISSTIENFKQFVSEQKKIRESLISLSQQPLTRVRDELNTVSQNVLSVTSELHKLSTRRDRLKDEVLKEEKNVGKAQRMCETGNMYQLENNVPMDYFFNKMTEFDNRTKLYKQELKVIEDYLSNQSHACLTPQALTTLLKQMDNEFICIAAEIHTAYEKIKALKGHYLRSLNTSSEDPRNPFAEVEKSVSRLRETQNSLSGFGDKDSKFDPRTPYGPSPFAANVVCSSSTLPSLSLTNFQSSALAIPSSINAPTSANIGIGFAPQLQFGQIACTTSGVSAFPFQQTGIGATNLSKPLFGGGLGAGAASATSLTSANTSGLGLFGPTNVQSLATSTTTAVVQPFSFGATSSSFTPEGGLFGKRSATGVNKPALSLFSAK